MILRNIATTILYFILFEHVSSLSYSRVYFQRGPDRLPIGYTNYGTPQIAELAVAPVASVPQLPDITRTSCFTPCIIVNSDTNSNLLNVPTKTLEDDSANYEYYYSVLNEATGDKKAQQEISDTGKVIGKYSVLQPDGYIREVQYTADDLQRFTTVFTKIFNNQSENIQGSIPWNTNNGTKNIENGEKNGKLKQNVENPIEQEKGDDALSKNIKVSEKPRGPKTLNDEKILQNKGSQVYVPGDNKVSGGSGTYNTYNYQGNQDASNIMESPGYSKDKVDKPLLSTFGSNIDSTYLDVSKIIKCIQASVKTSKSPLVYIIVPSTPCP